MSKAFRAYFTAALVLAVVAVGLLSVELGRVVKAAVETFGPRVLGAPVTVQFVALSPWSGRGTLRGLVVGSPPGYKCPESVSVGQVDVALRLPSLFSPTIVVERIAVRDPRIVWEMGAGGSNLTRLQANARTKAESKSGRSLLIKRLEITGGRVGLSAEAFGGGTLSAALPDLTLEDLGGPGRSPAEAAAQALRQVTAASQKAVGSIGARALDQAAGLLQRFLQRRPR